MAGVLAGTDFPSPILLVLFLCPGGFLLCVYFLFYLIGCGLEGNGPGPRDFLHLLRCFPASGPPLHTHWICCCSYLLVSRMQGKKSRSRTLHLPSYFASATHSAPFESNPDVRVPIFR